MKLICLHGITEEDHMNKDVNKLPAASANLRRRSSFVRSLALALALSTAFLSAAHAGPRKNDREAQRQAEPQQQQRQEEAPPPRQAEAQPQRQFDSRGFEARADERRRFLQTQQDQNAHGSDAMRRGGRLTPDEKRDLRRQINEAGLDIYPNAPRR
jgi:hypothetical protein